jgi:hypothetical protein
LPATQRRAGGDLAIAIDDQLCLQIKPRRREPIINASFRKLQTGWFQPTFLSPAKRLTPWSSTSSSA